MGNPKIIPLKSVCIAHILCGLKGLLRSGFKTSDQVPRFNAGLHVFILTNYCVHQSKAQADRQSAAYIEVCEHLPEAVLYLTL